MHRFAGGALSIARRCGVKNARSRFAHGRRSKDGARRGGTRSKRKTNKHWKSNSSCANHAAAIDSPHRTPAGDSGRVEKCHPRRRKTRPQRVKNAPKKQPANHEPFSGERDRRPDARGGAAFNQQSALLSFVFSWRLFRDSGACVKIDEMFRAFLFIALFT